jgi:hypothetical protein
MARGLRGRHGLDRRKLFTLTVMVQFTQDCLNERRFLSLADAMAGLHVCRRDHNENRSCSEMESSITTEVAHHIRLQAAAMMPGGRGRAVEGFRFHSTEMAEKVWITPVDRSQASV